MKQLLIISLLFISTISTAQTLCKGTTKTGQPCARKAKESGYCFQHNPSAAHCMGTTKSGQPCKVVVKEGVQYCSHHKK